METLRVVSWNVNGLRSYIVDDLASAKFRTKTEIKPDSNLDHLIQLYNPNVICFQETRCGLDNMAKFQITDWKVYSSSSQGCAGRSGNRYSGVSIWVHTSLVQQLGEPVKVLDILPTLNEPHHDGDLEGRFMALIYENVTIINTYVPNSGTNFTYRTERWDPAMLAFLEVEREKDRMTVWVGDLNVARTPYDVHFGDVSHTPKGLKLLNKNLDLTVQQEQMEQLRQELHSSPAMQGIGERVPAGFTRQERDGIQSILQSGYSDCWRCQHPITSGVYDGFTWWNLRVPVYRPNNRGWRIDYVIVDNKHLDNLVDCRVLREVGTKTHSRDTPKKYGSDHAPICATFNL